MKKKTLLILLAGCLFLTGCNKDNKRKTQLKNAGTDYYQTYMSGVSGIDKADVTLDMLKKANNSGNKEYKLKENGKLADLAPTMLDLMGIKQPEEMTGESLLIRE